MNPCTGEVLKLKDTSADFIQVILNGHFYFWPPAHIGQPFVASMMLVFVVMLATGIAKPDTSTYWKTDYRYFDQYSLMSWRRAIFKAGLKRPPPLKN